MCFENSLYYVQKYQILVIDDSNIPVQMWNKTVCLFGERILRMWRMSGMLKKDFLREGNRSKRQINMEILLGIKGTFQFSNGKHARK